MRNIMIVVLVLAGSMLLAGDDATATIKRVAVLRAEIEGLQTQLITKQAELDKLTGEKPVAEKSKFDMKGLSVSWPIVNTMRGTKAVALLSIVHKTGEEYTAIINVPYRSLTLTAKEALEVGKLLKNTDRYAKQFIAKPTTFKAIKKVTKWGYVSWYAQSGKFYVCILKECRNPGSVTIIKYFVSLTAEQANSIQPYLLEIPNRVNFLRKKLGK